MDIRGEARRLDVAFTASQYSGQSWIALPLALAVPQKVPQAVLPQDEYVLKVQEDAVTIKVISPGNWEELKAEKVGGMS